MSLRPKGHVELCKCDNLRKAIIKYYLMECSGIDGKRKVTSLEF
jgi:hypothetical protein